jgi:hypothetical protein
MSGSGSRHCKRRHVTRAQWDDDAMTLRGFRGNNNTSGRGRTSRRAHRRAFGWWTATKEGAQCGRCWQLDFEGGGVLQGMGGSGFGVRATRGRATVLFIGVTRGLRHGRHAKASVVRFSLAAAAALVL